MCWLTSVQRSQPVTHRQAAQCRENWEYTFFVDVLAHRDADAMQLAIEKAREHSRACGWWAVPRAQNVL